MIDDPGSAVDIFSLMNYVLSGLLFLVSSLLTYVWRSHVATIENLKKKVVEIENGHVTQTEFKEHVNKTEKLIEGIHKDLSNRFDNLQDRIDKLFIEKFRS